MSPPGTARRHALLLAAAVALFFAPAFHPGLQFLHRDQGRLHQPLKAYVAGELARGHVPQWIPELGLGMPVVAGTADGMQHPFHLLLLALPFELGLKLWLVLSVWLAGLGAAALARRLGCDPPAALVAGAAFAFSGFVVSSTDNMVYLSAMALVPWLLAAGLAHAARGGAWRLLGVGGASFLCAAAGDPQGWGIAVALLPLAPWLAPEPSPGWRTRLARGAAAVAASLAGAAPVLLPLALWAPASSRADGFDWIVHLQYALLPVRLAELVIPGLLRDAEPGPTSPLYMAYAGDATTPLPWILSQYAGASVAALAALSARTARGRWLLGLAALAAWSALGRHGGFGQLAQALPVLGSLRYWEKMTGWLHLGLALAAAAGAQSLLRDGAPRRLPAWLGGAAALLGALAAAAHLAPAAVARWAAPPGGDLGAAARLTANLAGGALHAALALLLLAGAAALAARPRGRAAALAPLALAAAVAADAGGANLQAYVLSPAAIAPGGGPIVEALRRQPGRPRVVTPFEIPPVRVAGLSPAEAVALVGARTATSGWNVGLRLGNVDYYTGMPPARPSRWRRRTGALGMLPGAGMFAATHVAIPGPAARAAEAGLPGPWRVAAEDPALGATLLEVPHRPRAYLAGRLRAVDRRAAMEFVLDGRNAVGDETVVESPVPSGHDGTRGRAEVVDDRAEAVEVALEAERAGLLVLNDAVTPGWTAEVDGRPAEIVPANYLVRGVWVPAGAHRVTFRYRTPGLLEGWLVLGAGGLGLALLAWRERRAAPRQG